MENIRRSQQQQQQQQKQQQQQQQFNKTTDHPPPSRSNSQMVTERPESRPKSLAVRSRIILFFLPIIPIITISSSYWKSNVAISTYLEFM